MTSLSDVTVVFVTYNSGGCIGAALAAVPAGMPVVVVDNASHDDTIERAKAARDDIRIEALRENVGYGRGLNHGLRIAATPFVLLANPDLMISAQAVEQLLEAAQTFPQSFLFSPLVHASTGEAEEFTRGGLFSEGHPLFKPLTRQNSKSRPFPKEAVEVDWIGGCVMLARRQTLVDFGGFDENIFLFFEETDLCYRATRAGHRPVFVPTTPMIHLVSRSSGEITTEKLYFRQWHFAWSRFYLARKYAYEVAWWQPLYYPVQYAIKRCWYGVLGRPRKAAYYAAHLDGALTALQNRPAQIRSPWDC